MCTRFFDNNTQILSDMMDVSIDNYDVYPLRLQSERQRITKKAYLDTIQVFLVSFIQTV